MDVLALVARILFVLVFLSSGVFGHLGPGRPMLTQFTGARKIPYPSFAVVFSGLWIVVGGLSLLLGIYGDVGALMLALFVVSTALFMHPFWKRVMSSKKMQEQVQFNKDDEGAYEIDGDRVAFNAGGGDVVYRWTIEGDELSFRFVKDEALPYKGLPDEAFNRPIYESKPFIAE